MVRNEERRIAGSIRRLLADGIDHVVVADNLSTDGTPDVLRELARDHPVTVVPDDESAFYQGPKVSLLARAAARCGAAWIVPFDADELWFATEGSIAETLHALEGDVAVAPMFDFLPRVDQELIADPFVEFTRRTVMPVTRKVAFRAHLMASVSSGNHWVSQPVRQVKGKLFIRHYPFLDFEHFLRKARGGTEAIEATDLSAKIGVHWRRWARMHDAALDEEWRTICEVDSVDDPLPQGVFEQGHGTRT
jgi:glycosyltransferase involved in cell wall biosynthesis